MTVDLRVEVGSVKLANPILAASGTFGYGLEFAHLADLNRLGGFVVKGLSLEPLNGAPAPRLCETASGMLNAVGLQNVGVRAFITEKLPKLRQFKSPVFANVFGTSVDEYTEVIRILEDVEGLTGYELNISCPNVKKGGMQYGTDPAMTAEVVSAARKVARRPLWVKLSPLVTDIVPIAQSAADSGADALTVANTYPAMSVDVQTRKSRLGNLCGGLSGPAIKPLTLRLVLEAVRAVKIPVIGLGGIETAADICEYLLVGASAVQVGTASFVDPRAVFRLIDALERQCIDLSINNINDLRGALKT